MGNPTIINFKLIVSCSSFRLIIHLTLSMVKITCECNFELFYLSSFSIWELLQRPIDMIAIWSLYAFTMSYKCEDDFESAFSESIAELVCALARLTHTKLYIKAK